MSDAPPVIIEDIDGVRWVTLNRPAKHNAQNTAMLERLAETIDATRHDASVRAFVLQGAGPSFSAGHDLGEILENRDYANAVATAEGRWEWERRLFIEPVERFRELPIPTLCVVRGHCLAAGLMFVATADLVVAAEDAVFGSRILPAMSINDAEVPALAWVLGDQQAKRLLWLGEFLDAREAQQLGLVTWVEPPETVDDRTAAVLAGLAAVGRETLALSKASLRFMADRQGWRDAANFHSMSHQLSHQTSGARAAEAARIAQIQDGRGSVAPAHRGDAETNEEATDG